MVAPDRERSACGHSMTMRDPLRLKARTNEEFEGYEVSGVPVDCVNVGLTMLYHSDDAQRPECDLVLSGFNHGANLGLDVTYSGTVAGAMEGAINGIRSIACSMARWDPTQPFYFETGEKWLVQNWPMLLQTELPPRTFLNVNVPSMPFEELKGFKFVPMGGRVYLDRVETRHDPWGEPYLWQGGFEVIEETQPGTDLEAVRDGYVSITPVMLDWTNYEVIQQLKAQFQSSSTTVANGEQ